MDTVHNAQPNFHWFDHGEEAGFKDCMGYHVMLAPGFGDKVRKLEILKSTVAFWDDAVIPEKLLQAWWF